MHAILFVVLGALLCYSSGSGFQSLGEPAGAYPAVEAGVKSGSSYRRIRAEDAPRISADMAAYCRFTNLASRAIYKNDFTLASTYFDSAFLYRKQPYFTDIKNYILVNSRCNQFRKNDRYIDMLLEARQLDTAFLFAQLPASVFSAQNLHHITNGLKMKAPKRAYNKSQQTVHDLFVSDQAVRDFQPVNMRDPAAARKAYEKRDSVDRVNVRRFLQLCRDSGFPGEEKLGIAYRQDMQWMEAIHVLLWHFVTTDRKHEVMAMLGQELATGNFHPALFASVAEVYNENIRTPKPEFNFMHTTVITMKGVAYRPFVYYSDSLMQLVNTNRLSIGLDSFHITQKQVVCERLFKKPDGKRVMAMTHYSEIEEFPYAIVKAAFEKEKQDLSKYVINVDKVLNECKCSEKCY